MTDLFSKYDIKAPVYIPPPGGRRIGSGRHKDWRRTSYPLRRISVPPKLAAAIVKARDNDVNENVMAEAIKDLL